MSNWRKYDSPCYSTVSVPFRNKVQLRNKMKLRKFFDWGLKIQYSTSAICKVNFNTSRTHAVKLTAKPSDTCRICNIYFKIAVGDFGKKNKYIFAENLFKIPERAGVASIPLAYLFKAHRSWSWSGSTRWEIFTSLQMRLRGKPRSATFQALCVCCVAPENC